MSDLVLCHMCKGMKQVPSMGGIMKECLTCQGLGHMRRETADEKLERYYGVKQQVTHSIAPVKNSIAKKIARQLENNSKAIAKAEREAIDTDAAI